MNNRLLKGSRFFRTAFYFPSVTSSVAISVVFLFLFTSGGAVNAAARLLRHPAVRHWFADPRGVIHLLLGELGTSTRRPAALAEHELFGLSWWDWLSGPSVAMCAIITLVVWTTSGTFMLMFLAGAAEHQRELEEASDARRRRRGGSGSG